MTSVECACIAAFTRHFSHDVMENCLKINRIMSLSLILCILTVMGSYWIFAFVFIISVALLAGDFSS